MKLKAAIATTLILGAGMVRANEWFVDVAGSPGGDGKTETNAFTTIRAAVQAASKEDVITVLPGTYDREECVDGYGYTNRVYLTKILHLRGKPGAAKPVIVGRWDPTSANGVGSAAIRCVLGVTGCIVENFILRDGAGHTSGADVYHSWAGGAVSTSADLGFYVVGCEFYNCTGHRGGAMRHGTAIRCRFEGNSGSSGAVARGLVAINCLFTRNGSGQNYITDSGTTRFYNCTFLANNTTYAFAGATLCNCVDLGCTNQRLTYSAGAISAYASAVMRAVSDTSPNISLDG